MERDALTHAGNAVPASAMPAPGGGAAAVVGDLELERVRAPATLTDALAGAACLITFVSDSCTIR